MVEVTDHYATYAYDKKIHYLAAGPVNGPLIFFIHGWPGSAITWKPQLEAFAAVGFRAIAADLPGYGKSTARRIVDDYSQEAIVEGMMALLADTHRDAAIWVGHGWGSVVVSSVATQYPHCVKALINLGVPFRTLERGWQGILPLVARDIYPVDEFEFGQWGYMKRYEEEFEQIVEWLEKDIEGICKAGFQPTTPPSNRRSTPWFMNGAPTPPSVDMTGPPTLPAEIFDAFIRDMQLTGFWTPSAYYLHHAQNFEYNGKKDTKLNQPALYIHAAYDLVGDTKTSRLMEPMRDACSNLTEATINSGHFLHYEKPEEVHAAIFRFIFEELPSEWPGFWAAGYTKRKSSV